MNQPANNPNSPRQRYGRPPTAAELAALHNPRRQRVAPSYPDVSWPRKSAPARRVHPYRPSPAIRQPITSLPSRKASPPLKIQRNPVSREPQKRNKPFWSSRKVLFSVAGIVIIAGGIFTIVRNTASDEQVQGVNQTQAEKELPEGTDETLPAANKLNNYQTAPDAPRIVTIPKLNITAQILAMGLGPKNQPKATSNIFETSWYDASAKAGEPGAMVIQGHIHGPSKPGAFYELKKIDINDVIQIENGDKTVFTYRVTKTQIFDAQNSDPSDITNQDTDGKSNLILITYTGKLEQVPNRYTERLAVFATLSQ